MFCNISIAFGKKYIATATVYNIFKNIPDINHKNDPKAAFSAFLLLDFCFLCNWNNLSQT
jgi:hypothetical protein